MFDLPFQGPLLTWTNKNPENPIARKLDRVLVTDTWMQKFPNSFALFEAAGESDHARCVIQLTSVGIKPKPSFKFSSFIADHPDYQNKARDTWNEPVIPGIQMFQLCQKLKAMKRVCKTINSRSFGNIQEITKQEKDQLITTQTELLNSPSPTLFQREVQERRQWDLLAAAEEKFFQQKSRVRWLKCGDQNTNYFHKAVQIRQAKCRIRSLLNERGERISEAAGLKDMIISYYKSLLCTTNNDCITPTVAEIQKLQKYRCTLEMKERIKTPPTRQEIQEVVFDMPKCKAPGPDGYPVEFYTKTWGIVGEDVIQLVQEFFRTGKILKQINATSISLIPKVVGADKLTDFRPISCCNTIYKIISKLIAKKLNLFLGQAVQWNQTGFIKGRSISENILLAAELVSNFQKTKDTTRGCLKIDLAKAYDNVSWDFILNTLTALDTPSCFVEWIKGCITTPTFSINLNGELIGYFDGKKGLRQGDPMSSYLFVLAMDLLSKKLDEAVGQGHIKLPQICKKPRVSHLSFADDLLVFFNGTDCSLQEIQKVLQEYYIDSGLRMNCNKSVLYLDGNKPEAHEMMANRFGLQHGVLPVKYLGLPLITQKLRRQEYEVLLECIQRRLNSWLVRRISFAGRLQLIKSVINSIINYWITVFLLPQACITELERMCSAFLWKGDSSSAKGAKISWEIICTPKHAGGLGLKKLAIWNKIFGLKVIWNLFKNTKSLWGEWAHHNLLKNKSLWVSNFNSKGSWIWRRVMKLRSQATQLLSCKINSGNNASFWHDNWTGHGTLANLLGSRASTVTGIAANASVKQACTNGEWRLSRGRSPIIAHLRRLLPITTPRGDVEDPDVYLWKNSATLKTTYFSSRATWKQLQPVYQKLPWIPRVWFHNCIPKHSFTTWVAAWNRLPTKDRLHKWGFDIREECVLCNNATENVDHLFITCRFANAVWRGLMRHRPPHGQTNVISMLIWLQRKHDSLEQSLIFKLIFQAIVYELWKERNQRLHNSTRKEVKDIIQGIQAIIRAKIISLPSPQHTHLTSTKLLEFWFRNHQS